MTDFPFPDHLPLARLPLPAADFAALEMRIESQNDNVDQLVRLLIDPAKRVSVPLSENCPIMHAHVQGTHETVPLQGMQTRLADAVIAYWWLVQYAAEHRKRAQGT